MKPTAYCFIRDLPHYRRDAFAAGLSAIGYSVQAYDRQPVFTPNDVLVIWNRYGHYDAMATSAEKAGSIVFVSENGFIGKDKNGNQLYQLAISGHNGSGFWHGHDDPERLNKCGILIKPEWRESTPNGKIVIRGQRGIGRPGVASPPHWHDEVARRVRSITKREVVVVEHPGANAVVDQSHERYLDGAHALIVWSSSVGVKALAMGVPVIAESPYWVCKPASASIGDINLSSLRSQEANARRISALNRMAWAQWTLEEIATGEPFEYLKREYKNHRQKEGVAA